MSSKERRFIHDISNPIAIAQGNIKLTLRKLSKDPDSLTVEEIVERLGKAITAFEKVNQIIIKRRADIISTDTDSEVS